MFFTYLRRELTNRRKQTVIIAIGMALAIGLVIIVSAVASGVKDAQTKVLESIYGVGTDITISQAAAAGAGGGPGSFEFGSGDGSIEDGASRFSQNQLSTPPGTVAFDESTLDAVSSVDNVAEATATLSLTNTSFNGEVPDFSQFQGPRPGGGGPPTTGGADGQGGSSFDVDSFTVEGIEVTSSRVGPATTVTLSAGRTFTAGDADSNVALLDSTYAATAELAVGDTIAIGETDFEVIGLVSSASGAASTASNSYIPLGVAQLVSELDGQVNNIYVQAETASAIDQVRDDLEEVLPDAQVSTQADLAASVSGSLATASELVTNLGTWLSIIVLAAAFLLAVLFTISGVGRRTREFGTLKAIGWSNGRIVRQVAGESMVQGLIGGAIGIAIGLVGVLVVNLVAPTLTASTGGQTALPADAGIAGELGRGGGFGGFAGMEQASSTTDIALTASATPLIILIAVGLALIGGLLAGAIGGWRAARLRPAEALRSVA